MEKEEMTRKDTEVAVGGHRKERFIGKGSAFSEGYLSQFVV